MLAWFGASLGGDDDAKVGRGAAGGWGAVFMVVGAGQRQLRGDSRAQRMVVLATLLVVWRGQQSRTRRGSATKALRGHRLRVA
jgi:hypothetical protein